MGLRTKSGKEEKHRKHLPKQLYSFDSDSKISVNDKEYDFKNLDEVNILSSSFSATLDGKKANVSCEHSYWSGRDIDGDAFLFMSKDEFGNVDYVNIAEVETQNSFTASDDHPGLFEPVIYDNVHEKSMFSMDEDYIITPHTHPSVLEILNYTENMTDIYDDIEIEEEEGVFTTFGCNNYKVLEIAIVYDSTFCSWTGGPTQAWNKISSIVSMASGKFQQDLCISLKISALEGHCNYSQDPYRKMRHQYSGCAYKGLLQDFTKYWHFNRKHIKRDAAHLFVGKKFTDGMIGCAGIGTLCKYAYGVEAIPWSSDISLQSNLFAHELAHNCGATHINSPSNVMNSYITHSYNGFSQTSKSNINSYLKYQNCV